MGKGGGGGAPPNQQVTSTTTNLPEYARPYFENLLQRGQAESYRQYQPYEAERLAGFSPGQVAAQQETLGMRTPGQFGAATGLTGAGGLSSLGAGQQFFGMAQDPASVQAFMSPYQQSVTDVARKAAIRDAQIAQQQINLGAVRQGTYGGARQALAQSERERGLLDRLAGIQAEGSQKAFEDARRSQQFGSELGLRGVGQSIQAGQTLGQLGQAQQQSDLQRLTAQETVGGQQRGFEQQRLDQQYADFLRQRDYPLEQLGYFSNLLRGVPIGLSSTQTTSAPPPSIASQLGGLGLAGLGFAGAARTAGLAEGGSVRSFAEGGEVDGPYMLQEPKDIAMEYGGNKQKIEQAAKMGLIDPTSAVMAGMFIDRMRNAQQEEMASRATVAQETFPQMAGLGATPQAAQMAQMAPQMPTEAGVAALPLPEDTFTAAGGGMVAFAKGGMTAEDIERLMREAEQGQGPNVSRPRTINRVPQGLTPGTPEDLLAFSQTGQMPSGVAFPFQPEVVEEEAVAATPSANLRGIDMQPIIAQATGIASALRPATLSTVPSVKEASQQTIDLLKESGFDSDIFGKIKQDVEKQREGLKGQKSEAINMRLIEAGLAIMGGTSPNAFENIGKGATGAVKGLTEDFKDLRKSERDLKSAEQSLMIKQNDLAMGRANITQSTIDKAQQRVDKETDNFNKNKADLTKTMLTGDIQERLARATYGSKVTDYDKKWARYVEEAKGRGETPTFSGFENALRESMGALTFKEALRIAGQDKGLTADEIEAQALKLMDVDKRRKADSGGQRGALSAQDRQAQQFAQANPNDPRSKQIMEYLNKQYGLR